MSHFTFTRSAYDDCALNTKQKENESAFGWMTDNSVVESKKSCYQGTSPLLSFALSGEQWANILLEKIPYGQAVSSSTLARRDTLTSFNSNSCCS